MENLKFIYLASTELKQDVVTQNNMVSEENNIALLGNHKEMVTLQLIYESDSNDSFPYTYVYLTIPEEQPCFKVVKKFELSKIYENSTIEESQQLALEPIYVAGYSQEAMKVKPIFASWLPLFKKTMPKIAVLTNYGACRIYCKTETSRIWGKELCNLDAFLQNDVFHKELEEGVGKNEFKPFKNLIDLIWITSLAWDAALDKPLIYIGTSAGYIVAIKFNEDFDEMWEICRCDTQLGRISYMKSFDNLLLVGNVYGGVYLYKVQLDDEKPNITKVECLWSKADRMSCQKAEVTYVKDLNSYFVVFTKAAHILVYRLSKEGSLICSSTLYISGVKISGLCMLNSMEFIIITINGNARHLKISSPSVEELKIEDQLIETDFNKNNLQVLGLATTKSHTIWSLLLYRKKDYIHGSRHANDSAFLYICKLSTLDPLTNIMNFNIELMDNYIDYAVICRMEILNSMNLEKYENFFNPITAQLPKEFTDAFLQKLQLKFLLLKALVRKQMMTFYFVKDQVKGEIEFFSHCIQITHIILRLQHLELIKLHDFTKFQIHALYCLQSKLKLLISSLLSKSTDESPLKNKIEKFCSLASAIPQYDMSVLKPFDEKCVHCDALINLKTLECPNGHQLKRCCVSYIQLPIFNKTFCGQCGVSALESCRLLAQLFAKNEKIKCTFCRFLFISDESINSFY